MINTKDQLPPEGIYVLAKHKKNNWKDKDQEGVQFIVVRLEKGISTQERESMKKGDLPDPTLTCWNRIDGSHQVKRSSLETSSDQCGNNLVPYSWVTFGPTTFHGQQIEEWQHLPRTEPVPNLNINER